MSYLCYEIPTTMNLFGKKTERPAEPQPAPQPVEPRPQRATAQMNPQQLARTQEALRLAQAKLQNIEDNLDRLRTQQEWLRRYNEVQMELTQEKTRLDALNKQLSTIMADETALRRFETFEEVLPTFLRMKMIQQAADQIRLVQTEHEKESKQLQEQWNVRQKVQQQATEKRQQAETVLYQAIDRIFQGCGLEAANETLENERDYAEEQIRRLRLSLDTLTASTREHATRIEALQRQIDEERTRRQSIEMHQPMIQHEESLLGKLDRLQEIETQQQLLRSRQAETLRRQDEEKTLQGRVGVQYQDVVSEITSVAEEIRRQRVAIQGQTTDAVLQRAMSLKSQLQMLLSAQSLWNRIVAGYTLIEEQTQAQNALRLDIEHNEASRRALETEVAQLTRLAHEKEYTYLLSKSQNVISLRADLVEGVSCSVCGAKHHPYHSDSMLEQSKLIGEFKTDFEQLSVEARNKQESLRQLQMLLAEQHGRYKTADATLATLHQRQQADEREWQVFSTLDRTFADCSPATNMGARQAMLRQLIEKTSQDASAAQADLENFNRHRDTINELSERMQTLEQRKYELNARLAEVNTACQLTARQAEHIQQQLDEEERYYSNLYGQLEQLITIPEWLREWKDSHEGLRGHIQQLAAQWHQSEHRIAEQEQQLRTEQEALKREQELHQQASQSCEAMEARRDTCQSRMAENLKTHEQAVGKGTAAALFHSTHEKLQQAKAEEQNELAQTRQMQHDVDHTQGRQDNYQQQSVSIAQELANERSRLDHWIRQFNQHNPPVQYSELEAVFNQGRDWNQLRAELSDLRTKHTLSQARTDQLNSQLVALQAEGGTSAAPTGSMQASLIAQQQTLGERRSELMLHIARLTLTLEEHRQAVADNPRPDTLMG